MKSLLIPKCRHIPRLTGAVLHDGSRRQPPEWRRQPHHHAPWPFGPFAALCQFRVTCRVRNRTGLAHRHAHQAGPHRCHTAFRTSPPKVPHVFRTVLEAHAPQLQGNHRHARVPQGITQFAFTPPIRHHGRGAAESAQGLPYQIRDCHGLAACHNQLAVPGAIDIQPAHAIPQAPLCQGRLRRERSQPSVASRPDSGQNAATALCAAVVPRSTPQTGRPA